MIINVLYGNFTKLAVTLLFELILDQCVMAVNILV